MPKNDKPSIFSQRVYDVVRCVPRGSVSTYQEIARRLGMRSARAVGQALKRNPFAPQVPCHRVVKSNGQISGFFGSMEERRVSEKISLLRDEGVDVVDGCIDLTRFLHQG
jgi:methylated-DNA-[protein]-cysteine S-methyltransferase